MSYAIKVLKDEKSILERCLSEWDIKTYPDARKLRESRLKSLSEAIETIKSKQ